MYLVITFCNTGYIGKKSSSRGWVVKVAELHSMNLSSTPNGTTINHWWQQQRHPMHQYCCHTGTLEGTSNSPTGTSVPWKAPVKSHWYLGTLEGTSEPRNKVFTIKLNSDVNLDVIYRQQKHICTCHRSPQPWELCPWRPVPSLLSARHPQHQNHLQQPLVQYNLCQLQSEAILLHKQYNLMLTLVVHTFPFSALTLLVGRQEGHLTCKQLGDGMLVVKIWLELCTSYSSSCHHYIHHP